MTGMTIDEVTKALTRGCCSRKQAADKQCDLCGPRYEAIDQVIRWHDTLDEATAYAREMSAHALESARKRYEAQVALVNAWGLLTREPMQQPVPLGGGGYAELNVPTIAEASNKAVEVVFRAESAERERDEALSMLATLTKAADHVGLMVYPHPLTTDGQRAVVELARTVGDAGAVVARLSREGAGRRPRPTKELEAEILTVVADAGSREVCCEDHDRGVAEEHEPCGPRPDRGQTAERQVHASAVVDGLMGFMLEQREAATVRVLELSARLPNELTFVQLPDDRAPGIDDRAPGIGRINIIELRAGARTLWRQWIELDGMTMRARSEWVETLAPPDGGAP